MTHFEEFKKIPRLNREIVISEKIDGTNGQIVIAPSILGADTDNKPLTAVTVDGVEYYVWAGSRNRWVYAEKSLDNSGFAAWVLERAPLLVEVLGEGRHYGEFWGAGIQRKYGQTIKRFSLFNTSKWQQALAQREYEGKPIPEGLGVVPVLYQGPWFESFPDNEGLMAIKTLFAPEVTIQMLKENGSFAAPGFPNPEGIVVYHTAANQYFKITVENDDKPKGSNEGA